MTTKAEAIAEIKRQAAQYLAEIEPQTPLTRDELDGFNSFPETREKLNGSEPPPVTSFDAFGDGDVVIDEPAPPNDVRQTLLTTVAWWREPETIPPREFLFGKHYIRGAVGATIGGGGRGKTTLGTCEAISLTVGRGCHDRRGVGERPAARFGSQCRGGPG